MASRSVAHTLSLLNPDPPRIRAPPRPTRCELQQCITPNRSRSSPTPLEDVQVRPADRRRVDPDDDVGRINDRRILDCVPASLVWAVINESFHAVLQSIIGLRPTFTRR